MKRPGSPRRSASLARAPMKRWRKPKRSAGETAASAAWFEAVIAQPATLVSVTDTHGANGESIRFEWVTYEVQAHHPIPRQVCRRHGAPEWDPRNGMKVSAVRHRRHHNLLEPITRAELEGHAPAAEAFALEYGLKAWFDRHYPVMCPDCKQPVSTHELYRDARCPVVLVRLSGHPDN